jgi:hypothetical protein
MVRPKRQANPSYQPGINYRLENPPDLAEWREKLFLLSRDLDLDRKSFEMYWPYVDNAWAYHKKNERKDGATVTHYHCR